jgi:hypothetical protein
VATSFLGSHAFFSPAWEKEQNWKDMTVHACAEFDTERLTPVLTDKSAYCFREY